MIPVLLIACAVLLGFVIFALFKVDRAEKLAAQRDKEIAEADRRVQQANEQLASETARIHSEAQAGVAAAQQQVERQLEEMTQEAERVRKHYESEARGIQITADAALNKALSELESLRKFENLRDAEAETKRVLAEAIEETQKLRAEGQILLQQARAAANQERLAAIEKVKDIHDQADARLVQALKDSGRIVLDAEKRAEQIAGSAYTALRDKEMLERAAEAMRNIIFGYGDRYLVPTHSVLDDLAAAYGYDAAAQSLASAREQSRRMVEQHLAAECDYVEENRRNIAIQFVIHAFNGSVDSILTRTKADNYGVLEQKIRDCYSIVNRDGSAFRNARILPAYLDARLAELKWAVVVQELAQRDREEQRYLKEQERDRQKAEQERLKKLREAEKEKELVRVAMEEAEKKFAAASAEQKAAAEKELQNLRQKLQEATTRELTIAQETVKGCVYIISNIGSFGDGVFKIGMTRRAAEERVDELSSASVPFEFDIHGVIKTDDVFALEDKIHQQFLAMRMNKINSRKEFFRVSLTEIRAVVEKLELGKDFHGTVSWTEKARAQQFYETRDIDANPESREKWLARAQQIAERRKRISARILASESATTPEQGEPLVLQGGATGTILDANSGDVHAKTGMQ